MQISGLDKSQAGINIARRNISNLRYADDNSLMADSEEELKNLLTRDKEESDKVDLKLNIEKRRSWHLVPTPHVKLMKMWQQWQILLVSKITVDGDCSHKIKKTLASWKEIYDKPHSVLKRRDITLSTKVHITKLGFSSSHVRT